MRIEMPSFHPSSWELICLLFIPRENWNVLFSSLVRIEMPSFHPSWELRRLLFIPRRENWDVFLSSFVVRIEMSCFHPSWELRCLLFIPKERLWDLHPSIEGLWNHWANESPRWYGYLVLTNRSLIELCLRNSWLDMIAKIRVSRFSW